MFIPYGSDTPIYHWPFATAGFIFINIAVFIIQSSNGDGVSAVEAYQEFQLAHGAGLHPIQWLTANFMHADALHLIGNMIFLSIFGYIVEGKVGPWIFIPLYLLIGIVWGAVEQSIFLPFTDYEGTHALGASGAIYGLMMVSMVWAPQDNIKMVVFYQALFSFMHMKAMGFNVPVLMFGLFYFLWDFSIALFTGFAVSTAMLHTVGGMVGLVAGVLLISVSWVDCEQRDLLSMFLELAGKEPIKKKLTNSEKEAIRAHRKAVANERANNVVMYQRSIAAHLGAGNPEAAARTFLQIVKIHEDAVWDEPSLLKLISAFQKKSNWDSVIHYSRHYLETYSTKRSAVLLNMAKILLLEKLSPRKSLNVVREIGDLNALDDRQKKAVRQIVAKANKMIAEGAIELD